jgi:hypothetical protein
MYIHLQKRKMAINTNNFNLYKIIPNAFESLEIPPEDIFSNFKKLKLKHWNWNFFKIKYANLKTKLRRFFHKIDL